MEVNSVMFIRYIATSPKEVTERTVIRCRKCKVTNEDEVAKILKEQHFNTTGQTMPTRLLELVLNSDKRVKVLCDSCRQAPTTCIAEDCDNKVVGQGKLCKDHKGTWGCYYCKRRLTTRSKTTKQLHYLICEECLSTRCAACGELTSKKLCKACQAIAYNKHAKSAAATCESCGKPSPHKRYCSACHKAYKEAAACRSNTFNKYTQQDRTSTYDARTGMIIRKT